MQPAQPPIRPRPNPGPIDAVPELPSMRPLPRPRPASPAVVTAEPAPEPIRLPGLLAALRRHPRSVRAGYAAAVATGVAVFVVAAQASPAARAHLANRPVRPAAAAGTSHATGRVPIYDTPTSAPKLAAQKVLKRKPTHSAKKAPVNHGVISGLAANGIPQVALNAYRVAAARMDNVDPGCGIDWSLLAGIGREESDHGRFAGAVLHTDGTSTPQIVGPALDGKHSDYIPAPGNGLALDGDALYAHALGPMQFIPSTWAGYGADANGDGKADIFNINDAALGAARYLCAAGGDLRTQGGRMQAVLTYNHNDQYLAQVLALANAYHLGIPVLGIPVGILTGPLPKVTDTGYIPPANPGAPTAVGHRHKHKHHKHHKGAKHSGGKHPVTHSGSGGHSKPGSSSAAPTGSASGTTPEPSPSPSKTHTPLLPRPTHTHPASGSGSPTPSPSPTKSCTRLQHLLHLC
jgi:membrane-bound lytic murein transglycosylase B